MHAGCLVPRGHMHTFYDAQCRSHESANCVCTYLCMYLHRHPLYVCCHFVDVIVLAYVTVLMFMLICVPCRVHVSIHAGVGESVCCLWIVRKC